uniref:Uncharacterized protein LOC111138107 n=1 Tax=Crassostrea virginica TaxID=6565 RepID=A0A8B8F1E9_CRAVI|nr:uncharacterized protein LOC111138107 [Crassostrea virginica]
MGTHTVTRDLFFLSVLFVAGISCFTIFRSCDDVKKGSDPPVTQDGEYPIFIKEKLVTVIYCADMNTSEPKAYLTLTDGQSNNYASVYDAIGSTDRYTPCTDAFPRQLNPERGRTEFSKIYFSSFPTLLVDRKSTFSSTTGPNTIGYGEGGDHFSLSPKCLPMGTFRIDLTGTPFIVSQKIEWQWSGKFYNTSQKGAALITNSSYIGCFYIANGPNGPSAYVADNDLTVESCIRFCNSRGFPFAGMQNSSYCLCGDRLHQLPSAKSEAECDNPCVGNHTEKCGGRDRISVYGTGYPQIIEGRCGGFPGLCVPQHKGLHDAYALELDLIPSHPCLQPINPCKNEGLCVARGAHAYGCQCHENYSGYNCEHNTVIFVDQYPGSVCPPLYQAETCSCDKTVKCAGARFDVDTCQTEKGLPRLGCVPSNFSHVVLFNVDGALGQQSVSCPTGADLVWCSYWDNSGHKLSNGEADRVKYSSGQCALLHPCPHCTLQARCKKFNCMCKNGGRCHQITGDCICKDGYYGTKCEIFDQCRRVEKEKRNCNWGNCRTVPENRIRTYGGDRKGDHCNFPFKVNGQSYGKCVEENLSDPPFACGAVFDGSLDGYIDLGPWSPGPLYTIAAWVRPAVADRARRTIVGGVSSCGDFGIYNFENFWMYYKGKNWTCTKGVDSSLPIQTGLWYLVAVTNNGTHVTGYANNQSSTVEVSPYSLPTTKGFWIGGEDCCPSGRFKGMIKSVKIWKRALAYHEIERSMKTINNKFSTTEALTGGLVGHYELGEDIKPHCIGVDHGGQDWTPPHESVISGTHCNISLFHIPSSYWVSVAPFNSIKDGGTLIIEARNILIEGQLDGSGSGYSGGHQTNVNCQGGKQGKSIIGVGEEPSTFNKNLGGSGGGGGSQNSEGKGMAGGGGGFGTPGTDAFNGDKTGTPAAGGRVYGDGTMSKLLMGSGGGSGACSNDPSKNPPGGDGGAGGGAIRLRAEMTVKISGGVYVNGADGQGDPGNSLSCESICPDLCQSTDTDRCYGNSTKNCWDDSGPGGGGSGGSIHIIGNVVKIDKNVISARGGVGGYGPRQVCGGAGGLGRIRIEAGILHGQPSSQAGVVSVHQIQRKIIDHSLPGREKIILASTKYGEEVYRGCFEASSSHPLPYVITSMHMTPYWCISLCRKLGYRYSGTEPPSYCFCDNHLDMNKKKDDGECSSPCAGNSMMTCGGVDRIQVFGPPPGTPAVVHAGVQQKCEPWCLTSRDSVPSWGQCDSHDTVATSYKTKCDCVPFVVGSRCNEFCKRGTYGDYCLKACPCVMNHTYECGLGDGYCSCFPGYHGDRCENPCTAGTYGLWCLGTCNCSKGSLCDHETGFCHCKPGFSGPSCDMPCPRGFYGRNCSESCRCKEHGSCDPVEGVCICQPGWTEELCGVPCDPYTFGVDCSLSCDCNGSPCNSVTGLCDCKPGKSGNKCQKDCPYQQYGKDCLQTCGCPQGCDSVSGVCLCPAGFFGEHCEFTCPLGSYGKNCQSRCQCIMNQTTSCDSSYGYCTCKDGFIGARCEHPCPVGYYRPACNSTCPRCEHSAPCDPTTGACICPPGWSGPNCEVPCGTGTYGKGCKQKCPTCNPGVCDPATGLCICQGGNSPCNCPSGYYGDSCQNTCHCIHGSCGTSGSCVCDKGWTGSLCDSVCSTGGSPDEGTSSSSCTPACTQCLHGRCHFNEEVCLCNTGYFGANCDKPCQNLTYGPGCIYQCDQCVHSNTCDPTTGRCQCLPGYTGDFCQKPCEKGFYGDKCQQTCNCQNGADCNNINGSCNCPPGFLGKDCSQTCPIGKYGPNCSLNCTCQPNSKGCDTLTGKCICLPGFSGDECQKSCPFLAYGEDCAKSCLDVCDRRGVLTCNPIDGACQCLPGYTGSKCNQSCPFGTWGFSCQERCFCGFHGDCDKETGVCDCDSGYNGTQCSQTCQNGFWGKHCKNVCNCGGATCNPVSGECMCPPGKMGHHCEQECGESHFGIQCAQLCGCQNQGICNSETGACRCLPGWSGNLCELRCPDGTYGDDCSFQCPGCRNGGSCDSVTGLCLCASGYIGDICEQTCKPGSWGVNCQNHCPSACGQSCLPDSGQCPCHQGSCLNGGICHQGKCVCQYGFLGDDCSLTLGGAAAAQTSGNDSVVMSPGQVAGVVVVVLVLIVLVVLLTIFIMKRRQRTRQSSVMNMGFNSSIRVQDDDSSVRGFSNPHYDNQPPDAETSEGARTKTDSQSEGTTA